MENESLTSGMVLQIHIARTAGAPVEHISEAYVRAGAGIDGDRYGRGEGTFSDYPKDHELTLIEAEVLELMAEAYSLYFQPGETRRNIMTRGIELNPLVGKRFRIGGALCEGTRLCEPCAYLEKITERPGISRLLAGRAGLRAIVLQDGVIRPGDAITVEP